MLQLAQFQINQQKAFELEVVEHQIQIEVFIIKANTLLAFNEGKALAQFQQKLLQVGDNRLFQVGFLIAFVIQIQEVQNIGIPQIVLCTLR